MRGFDRYRPTRTAKTSRVNSAARHEFVCDGVFEDYTLHGTSSTIFVGLVEDNHSDPVPPTSVAIRCELYACIGRRNLV